MRFEGTLGEMRKRKAYPPARTLRELAEEFGMEYRQLAKELKAAGIGPRLSYRSGTTHKNTWYDPAVVRAWWKANK